MWVKTRKVLIVAEAGVNHNGRLATAKRMVDAASDAGADAVKFQTFRAERITSVFAPKAAYQEKATGAGSQFEMIKNLELDADAHAELIKYAKKRDILFLSSPFDLKSIDLLDDLGLQIFKIPSGEITNLSYLHRVGSLRKKVMLSTGMSDMEEIKKALHILTNAGTPKMDIVLMHCTTEYPAPMKDVNLLAMIAIKKRFNVNVGYSDHTPGIEVAVAAAALGASVIEKHFTLDKNMKGPDHKASLSPAELKAMIRGIRNIEKALGSPIKRCAPSEFKNRSLVRKSIVAARAVEKGEIFKENDLEIKRPGTGISPMRWDKLVGRRAKRDFKKDELIEL